MIDAEWDQYQTLICSYVKNKKQGQTQKAYFVILRSGIIIHTIIHVEDKPPYLESQQKYFSVT